MLGDITYQEALVAFYDCKKSHPHKKEVVRFQVNLYDNLGDLVDEINHGHYVISQAKAFIVHWPVLREVFAASLRDRIVHRIIYNRIITMIENEYMIDDSFACRRGKGVLAGVLKASEYAKDVSDNYASPAFVYKGDMKSFFMKIDKDISLKIITDIIRKHGVNYGMSPKSIDFTCSLLEKVVRHRPQDNCIRYGNESEWRKLPKSKSLFYNDGLPIGDLLSQILANVLLSKFDKFVKERFSYYIRYMDDFLIFDKDKEKLTKFIPALRKYLVSLKVTLHPNKCYIQEIHHGVKFIGSIIKPGRIYIINRTKGSFYRLIYKLSSIINKTIKISDLTLSNILARINSYLGLLKHFATYKIRRKALESTEFYPLLAYFNIELGYQCVKSRRKLCLS